MANNCTNCGCSKISCGCGDSFLTTPPPCPTPADCPTAQPCSEVFDAQCVVYTGLDIECDNDVVVASGASVAEALNDLITYFCENTGPTTIINEGTGIDVTSTTVGNTTTYTISLASPGAITVVEAGDNVDVDVVTVGDTTTYTVNAIIPCPMDVTIIDSLVVPRGYFADVTGGTAPYTYQWSLADNGSLALLTTANGLPDIGIGVDAAANCRFDTNGNANGGTMSLLKITVTDANGCIAKDTFMWMQFNCE